MASTSRGWKMVEASLKLKQQQEQEDLTRSRSTRVSTSISKSTVEGTHFNVFDVDPDDPFDVDKERQQNIRGKKQDQTIEGKELEENLSFSDTVSDDDYIPNSASDDDSDDGSDVSLCVPNVSAFSQPEDTINATDGNSGNVNNSSASPASQPDETVNATDDNSSAASTANQRIKRPCVYCGIYQSQLLRHLKRKHEDEDAVKAALKLPKQDQRKAFDQIRKIGIFEKNVVLQKEGGELLRERRQGKNDETTVCNGCKGFFNAKQIWRHKKNCIEIKGCSVGSFKFSNYVVSAQDLQVTEDFKRDVLDCFRQDEVGGICRTDKMVIMIGQRLWAKSAKKEKHVIMSDMRLLANIILMMRSIKQDYTLDGKGILLRENFENLRDAIQSLSTTEMGSLKAGMKLKMGYLLKKLIKVSKGHFIQTDQLELAEETDRFASLLDLNWDFIFYTAQLHCEQRRSSLRKPQEMPVESDLSKLRDFIVREMKKLIEDEYKKWDVHDFILIRNLIVSRLTIFNARRGGEPARLTIKEWKDAKNDAWIDPQFVQQIDDPLEQSLLNQYKLAYQAGKGSRKLVPILIPIDTVAPLEKMVEVREEFDIPETNPFLFPNTGGSNNHVIGWHSINKVVSMISDTLEKPSLLIADKFRHRVSTLFALLELPAEDRCKFYRHMGHSEEISKNVYQSPLALGEIIKVGGFLQSIDGSAISQNLATCGTDTIRQDSETIHGENQQLEKEQVSASSSTVSPLGNETQEVEEEQVSSSADPESTKGCIKEKQSQRRYQKWSDKDTKLVRNYFSEFIFSRDQSGVKGSLPGKKIVEEFLKQHKIFQNNSSSDLLVSLVKTKVFNERKKERSNQSFKML